MNKKILLVSGYTIPFKGCFTNGAGLRTWGLGNALFERGYEVIFCLPQVLKKFYSGKKEEFPLRFYGPRDFDILVRKIEPGVIIFQNWTQVLLTDRKDIPKVLDFHGPIIMESEFSEGHTSFLHRRIKIDAIRRSDFYICAGEWQRKYFLAWLNMAGIPCDSRLIAAIPFSLSPDMPVKKINTDLVFVFGGTFLPWLNPIRYLVELVEIISQKKCGQLKIIGGKEIFSRLGISHYEEMLKVFKNNRYVRVMGILSQDQLIDEYVNSSVAVDLMEKTPEREIAFTSRTVNYLWAGLPVIYNNYAELSNYIDTYKAGWTIEDNLERFRVLVSQILKEPSDLNIYSDNAQRLVKENLTWDKTIDPLDRFCQAPYLREKKLNVSNKDIMRLLQYKISRVVKGDGIL